MPCIVLWITFLFTSHLISAIEETLWKANFDKAKINHHNTRLCVYIRNVEKCVTRDKAPGDPKEVAKLFNLVHSIVDVDDVTPGQPVRPDDFQPPSDEVIEDNDKDHNKSLDLSNFKFFLWKTPRPPTGKTLFDKLVEKWRETIKKGDQIKKRQHRHNTTTENPTNEASNNNSPETIGKFEINIKAILEAKLIKTEKQNPKTETEKATDATDNNHTVIIGLKDLDDEDLYENLNLIDIKNEPEVIKTVIKDKSNEKDAIDGKNEPKKNKIHKPIKIYKIDREKNNYTKEVNRKRANTKNVSNDRNMSTSYDSTYEYYSVSNENQENIDEMVRTRNKHDSSHKKRNKTSPKTTKLLKFKKISFLSGKRENLNDIINNYN